MRGASDILTGLLLRFYVCSVERGRIEGWKKDLGFRLAASTAMGDSPLLGLDLGVSGHQESGCAPFSCKFSLPVGSKLTKHFAGFGAKSP